jgi:hypothetical protein
VYAKDVPAVVAQAFGPDGTLYAAEPSECKIVTLDPRGRARTVAGGIRAGHLLVNSRNEIYAAEPGPHSDVPSQLWRIEPGGDKRLLDGSLLSASGIALSPDQSLLFAAERDGNRVYSFIATGDGALADKEPNYWLHPTDLPHGGGIGDLALDRTGDLYVATPIGIQVCDRNGRVRAILWVPFPGGAIEGIGWGGSGFDILYATDGIRAVPTHEPRGGIGGRSRSGPKGRCPDPRMLRRRGEDAVHRRVTHAVGRFRRSRPGEKPVRFSWVKGRPAARDRPAEGSAGPLQDPLGSLETTPVWSFLAQAPRGSHAGGSPPTLDASVTSEKSWTFLPTSS